MTACAAALLAVAGPVAAQDAAQDAPRATDDERAVVVGTGNRVSGRLDVVTVGAPSPAIAAAWDAVAAHAALRGLTVARRSCDSLRGVSLTAAVIVSAWPPREPIDEVALRMYARAGRGVLVLVGDAAAINGSFPEWTERTGARALAGIDPFAPAAWGASPEVMTLHRGEDVPHVVVVTPDRTPATALAVSVVRHAILRAGGVRHLPSAFGAVALRDDDGTLAVDAPTLLPGTVTMDAVTLDGTVVLAPGPLRAVRCDEVPAAEDTVLRLRFRGDGVKDEARVWLAAAPLGALATTTLEGLPSVRPGVPALFRVRASRADGRPAAGCTVTATLGDGADAATASATTDATGSAVVALVPPAGASQRGRSPPTEGEDAARAPVPSPEHQRTARRFRGAVVHDRQSLDVTVRGAWVTHRLAAGIEVRPPEPRCVVQADRPVFRPGGVVRLRAFALDPSGRPAAGVDATVDVTDPRGRRVRSFAATTGDFGEAVFEMPLAAFVTPGEWQATARAAGAASHTTFDVEDEDRPPFEARVEPAEAADPPDGRARGVVVVRDWDGVPLAGATARVGFDDATTATFSGDGRIPFDVAAPEWVARDGAKLHVAVRHGGEAVAAEAVVAAARRPGALAIDVGDVPGGSIEGPLEVTVTSAPGTTVDLDLVAADRLLAAATAVVADGATGTRVRFDVPADFSGPADVVARLRGARRGDAVVRRVVVAQRSLSVEVDAPGTVAPGDAFDTRIRVRDETGAPVAALLDVRGVDRAYAASWGADGLDPRAARSDFFAARVQVLASESCGTGRMAFSTRAVGAAGGKVAAAVVAARRGDPVDAVLPWGERLFAGEMDGVEVVVGEGLTTRRSEGISPGRVLETVWGRAAAVMPAVLLPVAPAAGADAAASLARRREWLCDHQSPDGSFHPTRFTDACVDGSCAGAGRPEMHVGATALVSLCFLGAGETHQSGSYRDTVKAALLWLTRHQAPDGFVGDRAAPCAVLNHALAASALVEAYGMTQSVLFRGPAERALAALAALQRDDGGFGEPGMGEGSLVAATIAAMTIRSADLAEIPAPTPVRDRLRAWFDAHADPAIGAPPLTDEEVAAYPFGRLHRRRAAAAAGLVSRQMLDRAPQRPLSDTPPDTSATRAATETLLADLPLWNSDAPEDALAIWLGSLAAFEIGGTPWRRWSEALQKCVIDHQCLEVGCCARGSWDDEDGRPGRVITTALFCLSMETFYRYGRVIGGKGDDDAPAPRVRSEFPDLLVSALDFRTDAVGERVLGLRVPDQVTTWRLDVGAWDRAGRYGRATSEVRATLPLAVRTALPRRLVVGDVVRVSVTVRSTLDADADASVTVEVEGGLEVVEAPPATVHVGAGSAATTTVTVRAAGPGRAVLRATVSGGGHADAAASSADVSRADPPFAVSVRVRAGVPVRLSVPPSGDAHAVLRLTGSPLGAATAALDALIRRPTGCFEQTVATLHPALLAWRLLGRPADDPRVAVLHEGVQRLLTFEAEGGGFGLYPGQDARADLTALGIDLLLDLDPVSPPDSGVLDRAGRFLAAHVPADPAARVVALGALRRLGVATDAALPDLGGDPYLVALALSRGLLDGDAARGATATLAAAAERRVDGTVVWRSSTTALFAGRSARDVETTATATLALQRAGGDPDLVRGGIETLRNAVGPDGAWGSTRETVAALQALLAATRNASAGRAAIEVTGRPTRTVDLGADLVEVDLGTWTGAETLTLRCDPDAGAAPHPWAVLCVRGTGAGAVPPRAPLALDVRWRSGPVPVGGTGSAVVSVENSGTAAVHAPMVVVPLPAGVVVRRSALEDAARSAGVPHAEVADGAVRLYLSSLAPGAVVIVTVPFTARVAGTYAAAPATAYPYYDPDALVTTPAAQVEVE